MSKVDYNALAPFIVEKCWWEREHRLIDTLRHASSVQT